MKYIAFFCFFLCIGQSVFGQRYASQLLDAVTKAPIPYATVQYGKELGTITNEEGFFSFELDRYSKKLDSAYISSMGYGKTGFSFTMFKSDSILLAPKSTTLLGVELFGEGLDAEEIIARVKQMAPENYQQLPVKKKFFLRQSTHDEIDRAELKVVSSSVDRIHQYLLDSITKALPKESTYHAETLGQLYKNKDSIKLTILRAAELYDKANQATFDALAEKLETIIKANTKEDSYYKIKTGVISTKFRFDPVANTSKKNPNPSSLKDLVQTNFLSRRRERLQLIEFQVFGKKSRFDVISKSKRYVFTLSEIIDQDGENRQYVIDFLPKKTAALSGRLFINTYDFALTRVEFGNKKPLKRIKLLGIDYNEPIYQGITVYSKMKNGKYELSFSKLEHHQYLNAERPLKIVEKNKNTKGRRQQNEIVLELYYTEKKSHSFEWVALENKAGSQSAFDLFPEDLVGDLTHLDKYDPTYWQGYTIIEPNKALQAFEIAQLD